MEKSRVVDLPSLASTFLRATSSSSVEGQHEKPSLSSTLESHSLSSATNDCTSSRNLFETSFSIDSCLLNFDDLVLTAVGCPIPDEEACVFFLSDVGEYSRTLAALPAY